MALDYTKGCVNFRDVGEWINEIAGYRLLPPRRILRGGKLDFVCSPAEVGRPETIISVRKSPDWHGWLFGARPFHFPISNDYEKYDTSIPEVRQWLIRILRCFENEVTGYPVLIHCTSGKDRTGVVVAALLAVLGLDPEMIVEEYLLSDGEVDEAWIRLALHGMGDPVAYFSDVNLETVVRNISG